MTFFLFFITFASTLFLLHFFIYKQVTAGLALTEQVSKIVATAFIVLAALMLIGRFSHIPFVIVLLGSFWLGIISISFTLFIMQRMVFLLFKKGRRIQTYVTLAFIFILASISIYNGVLPPQMKYVSFKTKKVPSDASPLTVILLSDLHLGALTSVYWLQDIVTKVNNEKPDVIVITGDLVDERFSFEKFGPILQKLKAKYGVFATTGNHEYYVGEGHLFFKALMDYSGITPLFNSGKEIDNGGYKFNLLGVNDFQGKNFNGTGEELYKAVKGIDTDHLTILLKHRPLNFKNSIKAGVDLQLSGHTHAGQIPPMDMLVYSIYDYPFGLYEKGDSAIYTTCGTGTWGPRMRLFSRSEIVKITIGSI